MSDFPENGVAVVIGAGGGIGGAMVEILRQDRRFSDVIPLSRASAPRLDLQDEASVAAAAETLQDRDVRLVFVASGYLHGDGYMPEKSWRSLDAEGLRRNFAVNAIGPALALKHFLPLLPRQGKAVFAALSARVGSIGDNRIGGWHGYRASKAALNQIVRTAAVELARKRPEAICAALHPGTVATRLSEPFAKDGLNVRPPETAARDLLAVIDGFGPEANGGFFDQTGETIPW